MSNTEFQTLSELFLKAVANHPKPDAFLFKSGGAYNALSSRQALETVASLAFELDRRGIGRGDRVAILSDNRVEWALTDYAVLGLGAILVPIYPTLLEPDVEYILCDSNIRAIVVSNATQLEKVLSVRARLPDLRSVLIMESLASLPAGIENWRGVVDAGRESITQAIEFLHARALQTQPGETASILYTSGTTGKAKGVILTHANLVSNILATQGLFRFDSSDVAMSFLPLCHIFERMLDYYYFWAGVSIAYAESFDALPQNLLEVRPTVMAVVPRVLEKTHAKVLEAVQQASGVRKKMFRWAVSVGLKHYPFRLDGRAAPLLLRLQHALADKLVASKVRARLGGRIHYFISGAAPLASEIAQFFYAMGLPVYEGYGLTETSPVISVNYPGHVKLGTVGPVIPGVEVKMGEAAASDENHGAGHEILVRGPNVSPGYYHLDNENRAAFEGGWFHTGDLGRVDSDGYLMISGRKKNLFKTSGGKYVAPEKLENLFQGHPYVSQVLVLGDGRKFVSALIVPNFPCLEKYARDRGLHFRGADDLVEKEEMVAFMQSQVDELTSMLPPHERIRQIALLPREFSIQEGELSATMKIKRSVVEGRYRAKIEELYLRPAPQARPA